MDERIKEGYQKVYSELFQIILVVCCLSVVIKTIFLGLHSRDCIPEFPIMVASPVYLLIRSRMLGLTQLGAVPDKDRKKKYYSLLSGLCGFFLVFIASSLKRGDKANLPAALGSCAIFAVCFLIVYGVFQKAERKRQEKLDSRYGDE